MIWPQFGSSVSNAPLPAPRTRRALARLQRIYTPTRAGGDVESAPRAAAQTCAGDRAPPQDSAVGSPRFLVVGVAAIPVHVVQGRPTGATARQWVGRIVGFEEEHFDVCPHRLICWLAGQGQVIRCVDRFESGAGNQRCPESAFCQPPRNFTASLKKRPVPATPLAQAC